MKNQYLLISIIVVFAIILSSCKKDDEQDVNKDELLLEKTWYNNPDLGRGNHFFSSDGSLLITNPTITGTWQWGPNDSMYISTTMGDNYTWWFRTIEENRMEYWPTYEPPNTFYQFTTTKP